MRILRTARDGNSISRISRRWVGRRLAASETHRRSKPASFGARRARVTYEFKGFRETPGRRARARPRSVEVNSAQTSLLEHSLRQDEDVQSFVAAQGLPLLPSLLRTFALPSVQPSSYLTSSRSSCLPRAPRTSRSFHPLRARPPPLSSSRPPPPPPSTPLPTPPNVPLAVRFW